MSALVAFLCVLLTIGSVTQSHAGSSAAVQNIAINIGLDGTINSVSSSFAIREESGSISAQKVNLNPQSILGVVPIRVSTAWWHDGSSGTDLADLNGVSGRISIGITVENLTMQPSEIYIEKDGAKYRQFVQVGIPFTVVLSTELKLEALGEIVTTGEDGQFTNGVAGITNDATQVQWAAMLAPPLLAPVTTFQLVVDTEKFKVPQFDMMIHPGIYTDPSLTSIFGAAFGVDSTSATLAEATFEAVTGISQEIEQGLILLEAIYSSLSKDASQLGSQMYYSLQASSNAMLARLDSIRDSMTQLRSSAQTDIESVQTSVGKDLAQLFHRLDSDVLGPSTAVSTFTSGTIEGCSIGLPKLADQVPWTLSSAVGLIKAQLDTVVASFTDPALGGSTSNNCLNKLLEEMKVSIGPPDADCSIDDSSVRCGIQAAQDNLYTNHVRLTELRASIDNQLSGLGLDQLSEQITKLANNIATFTEAISAMPDSMSKVGVGAVISTINSLRNSTLPEIRDSLTRIRTLTNSMLDGPGPTIDSVNKALASILADTSHVQTAMGNHRNSVQQYQDKVAALLGVISNNATALMTILASGREDFPAQLDTLLAAWSEIMASKSPSDLPHTWQTTLNSQIEHDMESDPRCPWPEGGLTGSIDEYLAGLNEIAAAECSASSTASLFAILLESYQGQQHIADITSGTRVDPARIENAKSELARIASEIKTEVDEFSVMDLLTEFSSIQSEVDGLSTTLSGMDLDQLEAKLQGILVELDKLAPVSNSDGLIDHLDTTLGEIVSMLNAKMFDDINSMLSALAETAKELHTGQVTPTMACPVPTPEPTPAQGGVDLVLYLGMSTKCQMTSLQAGLDTWFTAADDVYQQADNLIADAMDNTDKALDKHLAAMNDLAAAVTGEIAETNETISKSNQKMVESAREEARRGVNDIQNSFNQSTNSVVRDLVNQINAANRDAGATRTTLERDYQSVLASLGTPDQSSRDGLLGKIWGAISTTGDAVEVLNQISRVTSTRSHTLAAQLLDVELQEAQYRAALNRTSEMPKLHESLDGINVISVLSIHIGG